VPVTVTVNDPVVDPVQESVEVPEEPRVTLAVLRLQDRPVLGETVSDNATFPVKPFSAETVMVDVLGEPTDALTLVGLATIEKSGAGVTVKSTVAE
jgi:hypothetical protein